MQNSFIQTYYMKMVYFNGGRSLLADNFDYYRNLTDKVRLNDIFKKAVRIKTVSFKDTAGCCEDELLFMAVNLFKESCNIFCFEDDSSIKGKLMAVYIKEKDLFLFSDYQHRFKNITSINLDDCYYNCHRRKYSGEKYRSLAREFFAKSDSYCQ